MPRSPRNQAYFVLSILFGIAPLAFALLRARQANDLRMLWMAIASFVGAAIVIAIANSRKPKPKMGFALSAVILVVAMVFAGLTALKLGATAAAGIWPVAFVLSFCWTASYALNRLSRAR